MAHTNSGMRFQVMPGARILWIVTRKLTPVRMDENPRMNAPNVAEMTAVPVLVEYGV